jgi:hypothetical protein
MITTSINSNPLYLQSVNSYKGINVTLQASSSITSLKDFKYWIEPKLYITFDDTLDFDSPVYSYGEYKIEPVNSSGVFNLKSLLKQNTNYVRPRSIAFSYMRNDGSADSGVYRPIASGAGTNIFDVYSANVFRYNFSYGFEYNPEQSIIEVREDGPYVVLDIGTSVTADYKVGDTIRFQLDNGFYNPEYNNVDATILTLGSNSMKIDMISLVFPTPFTQTGKINYLKRDNTTDANKAKYYYSLNNIQRYEDSNNRYSFADIILDTGYDSQQDYTRKFYYPQTIFKKEVFWYGTQSIRVLDGNLLHKSYNQKYIYKDTYTPLHSKFQPADKYNTREKIKSIYKDENETLQFLLENSNQSFKINKLKVEGYDADFNTISTWIYNESSPTASYCTPDLTPTYSILSTYINTSYMYLKENIGLDDAAVYYSVNIGSSLSVEDYNATSSTTNTIGTGLKTFILTTPNRLFAYNDYIRVYNVPGTRQMLGYVVSYDKNTNELVFNSIAPTGSGSASGWTIDFNGDDTSVGVYLYEPIYYKIKECPPKSERIRLIFLNKLGAWEYFTFHHKNTIKTENQKTYSYSNIPGNYSFLSGEYGDRVTKNESKIIVTCETDYLTDYEYELLQDLVESSLIIHSVGDITFEAYGYAEDNIYYRKIKLEKSDFTKTNVNFDNGLFKMNISFTYAQDEINATEL